MELVKFVKAIGNKTASKVVSMPENWIAAKESEKGFYIDNQLVNRKADIILNTERIKSSKWIVILETNEDLKLATRKEFDDDLCYVFEFLSSEPYVDFYFSRNTARSNRSANFECYIDTLTKYSTLTFEEYTQNRSWFERKIHHTSLTMEYLIRKETNTKKLETVKKAADKKWEEYQKTVNDRIDYAVSFLKTMEWKIEETA